MRKPTCDCIRKTLNQFAEVEGITQTAQIFYISKNADKGYEEKSMFLLSNNCPQCGAPYVDDAREKTND